MRAITRRPIDRTMSLEMVIESFTKWSALPMPYPTPRGEGPAAAATGNGEREEIVEILVVHLGFGRESCFIKWRNGQ